MVGEKDLNCSWNAQRRKILEGKFVEIVLGGDD
jgi:hypothetical protein